MVNEHIINMRSVCFLLVVATVAILTNAAPSPANEAALDPLKNSRSTSADDFKEIDFRNFSYPYRFSSQRKIRVFLKNGRYEYDFKDERGWFDFRNVFFLDLTNDRHPEALVMLQHVGCGVSCDGGTALFYAYSIKKRKLKSLWQYETGSFAYGCGLKSLSNEHTKIKVELFGRCVGANASSSSTGKFLVKDITRLTFQSKGGKIVEVNRTYFSTPEQNVMNYEPQITISN